MPVLAVTVCHSVVIAAPSPAAENHSRHAPPGSNPKESKPEEAQPAPPPLIQQTTVNCQPATQETSPKKDASTKPTHDLIEWLNAGSTFVVAVFAVVTAVAIFRQVWTARDTDRAWIMATPITRSPPLGFIPEVGDALDVPGRDQRNIFACAIKGTGNTPAQLIDATVRYRRAERFEDIPQEPEYLPRGQLNDLPLVKDDSFAVVAILEPNAILSRTNRDAVIAGQQFLYAYGAVAYKDVFGRKHETRFGYIYHFPQGGDPTPNEFRRERLPIAYNRAT